MLVDGKRAYGTQVEVGGKQPQPDGGIVEAVGGGIEEEDGDTGAAGHENNR